MTALHCSLGMQSALNMLFKHLESLRITRITCMFHSSALTRRVSHLNFSFFFSLQRGSGQSPAEADLNLLETARRCELYGVKMHPAKVRTK